MTSLPDLTRLLPKTPIPPEVRPGTSDDIVKSVRGFSRIAAIPRRVARDTSAATRLSLIALLVALVSLVITSIVGLQRGSELADNVLRERLVTIGASRADDVERYIGSLRRAAVAQAISPSTADAIDQFANAYQELETEDPSEADEMAVNEHYRDIVAPRLEEVRGRSASAASLVPRAPAAVRLQASYVVPAEEGGLVVDAGDASRWSQVHRSLHPSFEEFVIRTGVDDFYLIEPESKVVVYSTTKDIDFGTSLVSGPQSGTALATLINSFDTEPEPGVTRIADYTSYAPAGDQPSAFIAGPVFSSGTLAGFVAIRIGIEQLDSITTDDASWEDFGDTGETYLAAADDLMRSDARGFVEDETSYLAAVRAAQTATGRQQRSMKQLGTTALFQPVDDVEATLRSGPRLVDTTNYLGAEVVSSQRPLDIEGLDWTMFSEIQRQEVEQPIADFVRNLLIVIAVFIVAITFLAVRWANRLLEPLRVISTRLRDVRGVSDGEPEVSPAALPANSPAEFVDLAEDIETMLETLETHNANAGERASERRGLLRRILPPQVVRRAEAGERDVLDQVAHATVAVVVIRGLGGLMQAGSTDEARRLLDDFVEEADVLANKRGLDRIRLTGDAYFAACGTARPHLDHAQRAAAFMLDVRELLVDLADGNQLIAMSAGLDSGPVTVGLTGGSRLVYDSWGPTVRTAADLARRAAPGEILASGATRSLLPSSFETTPSPGVDDSVVIVSRATQGGPVR